MAREGSKFGSPTEKTRRLRDLNGDIPLVVQLGRGTKTYKVTQIQTNQKGGAAATGPEREPLLTLEGQGKPLRRSKIYEARRSWADTLDPWYTNLVIYLVQELRERGHGLDQLNALMIQTPEIDTLTVGADQLLIEYVKKAVKFLWPRSEGRTEDQLRLDLWYYGPNGKIR